VEIEYAKKVPEMTDVSQSCFVKNSILWKKIAIHGGQHSVVVTPKTITDKIIKEVHGNILYGHEG
jgi:hypothetical protein